MKTSSKQLVLDTLNFKNTSGRVPRDLWVLPWADFTYPKQLKRLRKDFEWDITDAEIKYEKYPKTEGNAYEIGTFKDEWGCVFTNAQRGIIGEVKDPIVREDDWSDWEKNVHIPEELLSFDIERVNKKCKKSDKFIKASCCPRPFEQLQFIRGTVNLYMDLMDPPKQMLEFMERMHDYYCRLLTKWAQTDVDALMYMDDWGSQQSLLINPELWKKYFKPMYRDYIDIAHKHGKKMFMHSDGHILAIIPELIDLGLDALNSQIFCMGVENLAQFKGKITFWGEIDRQHLIPHGTPEQIDEAVKSVYDSLWSNGGCIAQCEFGPGANPDNVRRIFETWSNLK